MFPDNEGDELISKYLAAGLFDPKRRQIAAAASPAKLAPQPQHRKRNKARAKMAKQSRRINRSRK